MPAEDPFLQLLGPPVLRQGGGEHAFRPERPYLLLAHLACRQNWVRRDELADLLYPGREIDSARSNLRKLLFLARKVPGVGEIAQQGELLRWAPATDLLAFDRACAEQRWDEALAAHGGEFLLGLEVKGSGGEWLHAERQRVQARWHEACVRRLGQLAGEPESARRLAEAMLRHDPLDDLALQVLGRAQQALGRSDSALAALASFSERLSAAGLRPSAALDQLGRDLRGASPAPAPEGAAGAFVGRRHEQAQVRSRLAEPDCRVLTLLGPPGVGKSALARTVAAELGGAWVALEHLGDANSVPGYIAQLLGLAPKDQAEPWAGLAQAIGTSTVLLVLDNAEHLDLAEGLSRLLAMAPGVRLLAASRKPLGLAGEWRHGLDGLPLPDGDEADVEVLRANDAVRLFELRARPLAPAFDLAAEAADVVRLVHEVDGLPLAIELLAAWRRLMPVREILDELAASLDVLEGSVANERSVRASFARSWQQLGSTEQRLLAQLSVLPGPVGRELVRQVLQAPLPALAALVDRSLLRAEGDGLFALHPLVRRCAAPFATETEALRERHARHVAAVTARDALPLGAGVAHVRAAWRWALARRDIGLAGALAGPLTDHLMRRFQVRDCEQEMREAMTLLSADVPPTGELPRAGPVHDAARLLCRSQVLAASAVYALGQLDECLQLARRGMALAERLADGELRARCHARLGAVHWQRGDYDAARAEFEGLHRLTTSDADRIVAASWLALVDKAEGDYERAASRYEGAVELVRRAGTLQRHLYLLNNSGNLLRLLGRHARALEALHEGLRLARVHDQPGEQAFLLANLALAHETHGEPDLALDWAEQAVASAHEHGEPMIEVAARLARARLSAGRPRAGLDPLQEVLESWQTAQRVKSTPMQVQCLATGGVVLAALGRRDEGLALVRWAQSHPAFARSEREDAERHLARLGFAAGAEAPESARLDARAPVDEAWRRLS